MVLALFVRTGTIINTAKHSGVIAVFDKEFVHTGKIEKAFSRILHDLFDARQEFDYKELVNPTVEEAGERLRMARDFVTRMTDQNLASIADPELFHNGLNSKPVLLTSSSSGSSR
jgi:uncharacterized protein (UPF0332 family)